MSIKNWNAAKRRLVDMSAPAQPPESYPMPPPDETEDHRWTAQVSATVRYTVKMAQHRGLVVEFAIMLSVQENGTWHKVAKVDCSHLNVHLHQYWRSGGQDTPVKICDIPWEDENAAWKAVDNSFDEAVDLIGDRCDDLIDNWGSK